MYYLWSILVTMIVFFAIQYNEYNKSKYNRIPYNLISLKNIGTFLIIYIILTIILYMAFTQDIQNLTNSLSQRGGDKSINSYISADPLILRKISEDVDTGFRPV